jgi:hypothetical protein
VFPLQRSCCALFGFYLIAKARDRFCAVFSIAKNVMWRYFDDLHQVDDTENERRAGKCGCGV